MINRRCNKIASIKKCSSKTASIKHSLVIAMVLALFVIIYFFFAIRSFPFCDDMQSIIDYIFAIIFMAHLYQKTNKIPNLNLLIIEINMHLIAKKWIPKTVKSCTYLNDWYKYTIEVSWCWKKKNNQLIYNNIMKRKKHNTHVFCYFPNILKLNLFIKKKTT